MSDVCHRQIEEALCGFSECDNFLLIPEELLAHDRLSACLVGIEVRSPVFLILAIESFERLLKVRLAEVEVPLLVLTEQIVAIWIRVAE